MTDPEYEEIDTQLFLPVLMRFVRRPINGLTVFKGFSLGRWNWKLPAEYRFSCSTRDSSSIFYYDRLPIDLFFLIFIDIDRCHLDWRRWSFLFKNYFVEIVSFSKPGKSIISSKGCLKDQK